MELKNLFAVFVLSFTLLCLVSCMNIRAVDPDKQDDKKESEQVTQSEARVTGAPYIEALAAPNSYQVLIPVDQDFGAVIVHRTGPDKIKQQLVLPSSHSFAIDEKVKGGETYVYEWEGSKIELRIPVDFEVKGAMDSSQKEVVDLFSPKKNWGRLWFHDKSVLTTLGQDLNLEVNEIVSAGSAILQTFQDEAHAEVGKNGRHGGRLLLRAKSARGHLRLELRGEDGGVGVPGTDTHALAQYRGVREDSGYKFEQYVCSNVTPPAGNQGGPGGRGGNTPHLTLDLLEAKDFHADVVTEPGLAGRGGPGGHGGVIPPGELFVSREYSGCYPGADGPEGYPGLPGNMEQICRREKGEILCAR